jgi:hypothetical protein
LIFSEGVDHINIRADLYGIYDAKSISSMLNTAFNAFERLDTIGFAALCGNR